MGRGAIAFVLSLSPLWASGPAAAQPRLQVRIVDRGDLAPLLDRFRGQLSDVNVALTVGPDAEGAHDVVLRVDGMATLDGPEPELIVAVSVPGTRTALRRGLRPARSGAERSALLEQAALFVRATLLALSEGGTLGVRRPSPPPRAAPRAEPAAEAPAPGRAEAPRRVRPALGAGPWWALDGQTERGQRGVALALDLQIGLLRVGAHVGVGLPTESADERTRLHLTHLGADAYASFEGAPRTGLQLGAGVSIGAGLIHRSTQPLRPGIAPTPPAWTTTFRVGPRLAVRWRPGPARAELELAFTLDVVPRPVVFAYAPDGPRRSMWHLQPRLALLVRMLP